MDLAFEVDARVTFDSAYPYISIPKRHINDFKTHFMNPHFNNTYKEKGMMTPLILFVQMSL